MTRRLQLRGSWGPRDATDLAFHRRYYRWWTFVVHRNGIKLGPITLSCLCRPRTRQFAVDVLWMNFYGFGLWYL